MKILYLILAKIYEAHHKAFTIAKITKIDLLNDIKDSLENSFKSGVKFKEWKENLKPNLEKHGWIGKTIVTNPQNGESKEIYVSSRRLRNIYNTNIRASYAKTRYENQMNSLGQYFRYVSVLDSKTRHAHKKLHGTILPKTDPFWYKNYPPNDWGCRCKVQVLSDEEMKTKGLIPLTDSSMLNDIASNDWAYNPGKNDNLGELLEKKAKQSNLNLDSLKQDINLSAWQSGLDNAINELLIKKNLKSPIEAFMLGALDDDIIKKASKELNIQIDTNSIMGDKHGVLHIRPDRKERYGQDLRIDELKNIVNVLNDINTPISVDTEQQGLIFWFNDIRNEDKMNKIVIHLNYKLKKFGLTNYMVTVGKIDIIDSQHKRYRKIR